ncbi:MAG: hypothetical protein ACM3O3_10200 [Syntrophothermus sp.]
MKIMKGVRSTIVIATFAVSSAFFAGCGGVSDAQMEELKNLRNEVSSLESEVNSLRDERTRLEREMQEKNAKLQQCAKDKEETRANLEKLPQ